MNCMVNSMLIWYTSFDDEFLFYKQVLQAKGLLSDNFIGSTVGGQPYVYMRISEFGERCIAFILAGRQREDGRFKITFSVLTITAKAIRWIFIYLALFRNFLAIILNMSIGSILKFIGVVNVMKLIRDINEKKSGRFYRVVKALRLDADKKHFESIYFTVTAKFGQKVPKEIEQLFARTEIREAFKAEFYQQKKSAVFPALDYLMQSEPALQSYRRHLSYRILPIRGGQSLLSSKYHGICFLLRSVCLFNGEVHHLL